jgi:hypothetical protein
LSNLLYLLTYPPALANWLISNTFRRRHAALFKDRGCGYPVFGQINHKLGVMNPIQWLEQNAPGFDALPEQERAAIAHFALLWSFFEARALSTRGSSQAILALTHEWLAQGHLTTEPFSESLQYFQQRYYANGLETHYLAGLNLRPNDCRDLVTLC